MHDPIISRRLVLAGGLLALAPMRAFAAAEPSRLAFIALRNGKKIGEQHMTFDRDDGLTVRTQVDLAIKLGPIQLYSYRHEATERWRDGRFQSLETQTADNGKSLRVQARREDGAVTISPATGGPLQAARDALPFTHWNRDIAKAPLFNPQDGKLLRETVSTPAPRVVPLADGSSRKAQGVTFRGDASIEDWYDEDGVWTFLTGRLKDGSMLEYRRL
jgi:hypothetical protein